MHSEFAELIAFPVAGDPVAAGLVDRDQKN